MFKTVLLLLFSHLFAFLWMYVIVKLFYIYSFIYLLPLTFHQSQNGFSVCTRKLVEFIGPEMVALKKNEKNSKSDCLALSSMNRFDFHFFLRKKEVIFIELYFKFYFFFLNYVIDSL